MLSYIITFTLADSGATPTAPRPSTFVAPTRGPVGSEYG